MKILIDTNIILDVLCERKPYIEYSAKIFKLCEAKQIIGYISALSIPNIVYIMRKELSNQITKTIIDKLFNLFEICDLKADYLNKANCLDIKDYEDALQSLTAIDIKADYIVTRNIKDFVNSKVEAVSPEIFLTKINFSNIL